MKLYTTKEQTAHLIELGFPKPQLVDIEITCFCTLSEYYVTDKDEYGYEYFYDNYSIGDLISYLGMNLMGIHPTKMCNLPIKYVVQYKRDIKSIGYVQIQGELIDKLYDACVTLKNEGVI